MMFVLLLTSCTRTAQDAAPFAGVLVPLDDNQDGHVSVEEFPKRPPGGVLAEKVDKNADGTIDAGEVRDEVFAVDPATYDRMAWSHSGSGKSTPQAERAVAGPLAEVLRFLAAEAESEHPGAPVPTAAEIDAAARAGMDSEPGRAILALLAASVPIPEGLATAPADPEATAPGGTPPAGMRDEERLQSDGPGGAAALRVARGTPNRPRPGSGPGPGAGGPRGPGGPGTPKPPPQEDDEPPAP